MYMETIYQAMSSVEKIVFPLKKTIKTLKLQ